MLVTRWIGDRSSLTTNIVPALQVEPTSHGHHQAKAKETQQLRQSKRNATSSMVVLFGWTVQTAVWLRDGAHFLLIIPFFISLLLKNKESVGFKPATSDHKECKQYHWTITSVAMMWGWFILCTQFLVDISRPRGSTGMVELLRPRPRGALSLLPASSFFFLIYT